MTALSRDKLSYYNNWGAIWLWASNREKLQQIMKHANSSDLFMTLVRSLELQNLWSWDPNKTYPIRAAQGYIAQELSKIWLPSDLCEKPDIIWSIGLPESVCDILTAQFKSN